MKKNVLLLFAIVATLFISTIPSCKYNNDEELHPKCDTATVTYGATIIPILQNNCYRCHGTATNSNSGGIILQDYNVLKGYAADGKLYGNVAHLPGYVAMPYGGGKLSDCDIAKIKKWVDVGYPNN